MTQSSSTSTSEPLSLVHSDDEASLAYTALLQYRRESSIIETDNGLDSGRNSVERRRHIQDGIDELVSDSKQMLQTLRSSITNTDDYSLRQLQLHIIDGTEDKPESNRASLADILSSRDALPKSSSNPDDNDQDDDGGSEEVQTSRKKKHRPERKFPQVEHRDRHPIVHHPESSAAHRERVVAAELQRRTGLEQRLEARMAAAERQREHMHKEWQDHRRGFGDRASSWLTKVILVAHLERSSWQVQMRYLRAGGILRNQFVPLVQYFLRQTRRKLLLQDALSGRGELLRAPSSSPLNSSAAAFGPSVSSSDYGFSLPRPSVESLMQSSHIVARWPEEVAQQLVREMQPVAMLRGSMPLIRGEDPLRCVTAFFFLAHGKILVGEDIVLKSSSSSGRNSSGLATATAASGVVSASTQAAAAVVAAQALQHARAGSTGNNNSSTGVAGLVSSLCVVQPGEYFGDVAVVCGDPVAAPIRCTSDCILFAVSGGRFMQLMHSIAASVPRALKSSLAACKLLLRIQLSSQRRMEVEELKDVDPVFGSMPNGAVQAMIHKAFPVVLFNGEVLSRNAHSSPCVYFVEMGRLTGKLHYNSAAESHFFSSSSSSPPSSPANNEQSATATTNRQVQQQLQQNMQQKQLLQKKLFQAHLRHIPVVEYLAGSVLCMSSFCRCELFDDDPVYDEGEISEEEQLRKAQQQNQHAAFYDSSSRNAITARSLTVVWAFPIPEMNKILQPFFKQKKSEARIVEMASNAVFDGVMERAGLVLQSVKAFGVDKGLLRPKNMFQIRELFYPIVAVAGSVLCKSGGDPLEVLVVVEGTVLWQRRRYFEQVDDITGETKNVFETIELGRGGPGSVIGLAECLAARNFALWCTCDSSCVLLRAKTEDVRRLLESFQEETAWAVVWNAMSESERAATRAKQKELERRRLVTMSVLPVEQTAAALAQQKQQQQQGYIAPPGAGIDVKAARALCRKRISREVQVARAEQARRDELEHNRPRSPYSQWLASALESRRIEARRIAIEQRVITSISSRVFGDQMSEQDKFIKTYFDPASEENLKSFSASMFAQEDANEALQLSLTANRLVQANNTNSSNSNNKSAVTILAPSTPVVKKKQSISAGAGGGGGPHLPQVQIKDMLEPAQRAANAAAVERRRRGDDEQQQLQQQSPMLMSGPDSPASSVGAVREKKVQIAQERADEAMDREVDAKVQEVLKQQQQRQRRTTTEQQQQQQLPRRVMMPPLIDNDTNVSSAAATSDAPTNRSESDLSFSNELRHMDVAVSSTASGGTSGALAAKAAMRERRLKKSSRQQFAHAETFSRARREATIEEKRIAPEELNHMALDFLIKNCPALSRKQEQESMASRSTQQQQQQQQTTVPKPPATSRAGAAASSKQLLPPVGGSEARTARLPAVPVFSHTKLDAAQHRAFRREERAKTDDLLKALFQKTNLT